MKLQIKLPLTVLSIIAVPALLVFYMVYKTLCWNVCNVQINEQAGNITVILVISFLLLCIIVAGALRFVLGRFASRLEESTSTAYSIALGNFDDRIDERYDDELGKFFKVFNGMVDTLMHIKQGLQNEVESQIAQIKESMEEAEREEELFRNTFEAANIGLAHVSPDGRFLRINHGFCEMLGYTIEEMLSIDFAKVTHPDDIEEDWRNVKMLLNDEANSYAMQKRYFSKNGKIVWALLTVALIRDAKNKPAYFISAVQDITHIKELELSNAELLERNRLLLESSGEGLMGLDVDGSIIFVNLAATQILGFEGEWLLGKNAHAVLHHNKPNGEEYPEEKCPVTATLKEGEIQSQEGDYFITKSGRFVPVEFTSTPIYKDSVIIGAVLLFRDVTYRNAMEEAILKSEQKFRNLVESTSDWIWETDAEGIYTYASPQVTRLLGYRPKEVVGKSYFDLMKPSEVESIKKQFEEITKHKRQIKNMVNICLHRDGHEVYLETNGAPVLNDNGELIGYEGVDRDITERLEKEKLVKDQEQMLIAQSRQAAMGEMIGMIAHQWRQPITAIGMAINNLKADIELDMVDAKGFSVSLNDMGLLVLHLSKTIDDFRDFFKEDREKERSSVDSIVEDAIHIIGKSLINNNIELRLNLNAPVESMLFKREMIQVLLNIIKNAKDVSQERGVKRAYIEIKSEQNDNEVVISICDNAGGIAADVLPRVFEPYFTTRGPTSGTGLGLYMSDIIVRNHHGGKIEATNTQDGSCFTIKLPI
jgi:PAS domain S-box-containing protein